MTEGMLVLVVLITLLWVAAIVQYWEIDYLRKEIERLKEGSFTEEEFQNLCHNFTTDDRRRFEQGCKEYSDKLFGEMDLPFDGDSE